LSARERLAGQTAAYAIAGTIGKIAGLLTVPYLTRQLSPDGYGLADLATSFAALVTLLVRFGGDVPAARMRARATDQVQRNVIQGTYVLTTIAVAVAAAFLLLPLAPIVAEALWASPNGAPLAAASLLLVPITAAQAALASVLRFESRSRAFAVVASIDLATKLGAVVLLVSLGLGPLGVIVGFVIGGAVGAVATAVAARPMLAVTWQPGSARRLIAEGLPFLPTMAAFVLADTLSRVIAANHLGVSDVGQLAVAIRIGSVMALAATAFSLAWGPYGLGLQPSSRTSEVFSTVLVAFSAVAVLGAIAVGAVAPELAIVAGGEEFSAASAAAPGLLMAGALSGIIFVLATAAGVLRRDVAVAASVSVGAVIQVIASFALVSALGIVGIALAAILGRIVTSVWLGGAVSESIGYAAGVVPVIVAAGLAGLLVVQFLVENSADTLVIRLVICGIAGSAAFWVAGKVVRTNPGLGQRLI
jgi:O-antigen/teichoic acid export membrane protein